MVQFFYSADRGRTYGNMTKEYEVGETVYMKVIFNTTLNRNRSRPITATLTIPNIDAVDARYFDGQIITPVFDPINNVTTYTFAINAVRNRDETSATLQFRPNSAATVTMTFMFDDTIDPSHNRQSTIEFVEMAIVSINVPNDINSDDIGVNTDDNGDD
jgi:hypothetical protein